MSDEEREALIAHLMGLSDAWKRVVAHVMVGKEGEQYTQEGEQGMRDLVDRIEAENRLDQLEQEIGYHDLVQQALRG